MIIDRKNISDYGLVYDRNDEGIKYAAAHINKYLKICMGTEFADFLEHKHFISIGKNSISEKIIENDPISNDKYDGYRIIFRDGNVYIFGNSIRSTIYGVYAFIEKFLGVRWFHKNAEFTPKLNEINVEEKDIFEWSYFPQRELTYLPFTTDW